MSRIVESGDPTQQTLPPTSMNVCLAKDNLESGSRPAYHLSILLKIYLYGYLSQVVVEREASRSTKLMQLNWTKLDRCWSTCQVLQRTLVTKCQIGFLRHTALDYVGMKTVESSLCNWYLLRTKFE